MPLCFCKPSETLDFQPAGESGNPPQSGHGGLVFFLWKSPLMFHLGMRLEIEALLDPNALFLLHIRA